jgi:hypothetical protein
VNDRKWRNLRLGGGEGLILTRRLLCHVEGQLCQLKTMEEGEAVFLRTLPAVHEVLMWSRCWLVKPSLAKPLRTSGAPMNSLHKSPVRWFSIIAMIGP